MALQHDLGLGIGPGVAGDDGKHSLGSRRKSNSRGGVFSFLARFVFLEGDGDWRLITSTSSFELELVDGWRRVLAGGADEV